jgi:hypothetical protein
MRRALDFAIYILIALTLVGLVIWGADHYPSVDANRFGKWLALVGNTAVLFGYAIKSGREFWRRRAFWLVISVFLASHLLVFSLILSSVQRFPFYWFVVTYPIELSAIAIALDWVVDRRWLTRPIRKKTRH